VRHPYTGKSHFDDDDNNNKKYKDLTTEIQRMWNVKTKGRLGLFQSHLENM